MVHFGLGISRLNSSFVLFSLVTMGCLTRRTLYFNVGQKCALVSLFKKGKIVHSFQL